MEYINLADMLFSKREKFPQHPAYEYKEDDRRVTVTYEEAVQLAEKAACGFILLGITKGSKIAIISNNRLEWAICDYAALSLGAALVPVYPSLPARQTQYILNDSAVKIVIAENELQLEKIDTIRNNLKSAENFIVFNKPEKDLPESWQLFSELCDDGAKLLAENSRIIQDSIKKIKRSDPATVIYTSGTTGEPKGTVLSHNNFLSNLESVSKVFDCYPEDVFLSFLPLSHVLERTAGHFFPVYSGSKIVFAQSIETVPQDMIETKPTLMISVPRLYEKMYSRVLEMVETGPALKRRIFYNAIETGKKYRRRLQSGRPISPMLALKHKIADILVYKKLKQRVGGRLRFFVSGGAPLSAEIGEFFAAAGIIILEGYGLTETSPGISFNKPDDFRFGTVGMPIPGVEVKIAKDGEILARGDNIMMGYLNKEEETKEVIDENGWFYTGDIGLIDANGFLVITDRKKNIIVTSGGKNVAPQPIENSIINSKYIEQAVVIGDNRKFCSAVIVPEKEALLSWANKEKISFADYDELLKIKETYQLLEQEIENRTAEIAAYERIRKILLVSEPFTLEGGELTPTLKVKRRVIEQKYKNEIDKLYQH